MFDMVPTSFVKSVALRKSQLIKSSSVKNFEIGENLLQNGTLHFVFRFNC